MFGKADLAPHPYRVSVTWGALERLDPTVERTAVLSPEEPGARNSVGVKFSGFGAGLNADGTASRAVAVSSVVTPVTLPAEPPRDTDGSRLDMAFLGYKFILRGFVEKPKDARAVITVNVAGTTKVIEFPFDAEYGFTDTAQLPADFEVQFFAVQHISPSGDPPAYPTPPAFGAEIMIAVERRQPDAAVLVQVDELDVTAAFSSPDGPVPSKEGR
jgi:hypothetical protein